MSITINRDEISRQLTEIEEDAGHRADMRRRQASQALAALGLLSAAAREAYRRDVLPTLPAARLLLASAHPDLYADDRRAGAVLDAHRLQATLRPSVDSLSDSAASTSSHAASIALSVVGGERRAQEHPWLSIASAGFSALGAIAAGRQVLEDIEDGHLDVCSTVNAVASIAAVPLTFPEALRAIRGLLAR